MTSEEALQKILPLFEVYYAVERETPVPPFSAEASFTVRDEHYALYRTVKYADAESREYIFFAVTDKATLETAKRFDEAAWSEGLSRVEPGPNHRNTDIALVLLADEVEPAAAAYFKKLRRSKNYKFMFHGWSNYRAIVIETASGAMTSNRLGRSLRELFDNIKF